MGKPSRDKGKRGEREVVDLFRAAGSRTAARTAPLQAGQVEGEADVRIGEGFHLEVKRCERLRVPDWLRQLDRDAPEGAEGILAFRRSRERWQGVVTHRLLMDLEEELGVSIPTTQPASTIIHTSGRRQVDLLELAHLMIEAGWVE